MSTSETLYRYRPFDAGTEARYALRGASSHAEHHIRLLRITGLNNHDEPMILLRAASLHTVSHDFTALSYTWGPVSPTRRVWIDDTFLEIRENIWHFLHACASRRLNLGRNTEFWIDSICINQTDNLEKAAQVQMMGDIFSRARRVVIWLGRNTLDFNAAREMILACTRMRLDGERSDTIRGRTIEYVEQILNQDQQRRQWNALQQEVKAIFEASYWKRLWIVQEVALAQQIAVVIGHSAIPLSRVTAFVQPAIAADIDTLSSDSLWCRKAPNQPRDLKRAVDWLYRVLDRSRYWNIIDWGLEVGHDFCMLFEGLANQECSDPRDRVFGLLSLTPYPEIFEVDYSLSVQDLAKKTVKFMYDQGERYLDEDFLNTEFLLTALGIWDDAGIPLEYQGEAF